MKRKFRLGMENNGNRQVALEGLLAILIKYGGSAASVLMLAALARAIGAVDFGYYGFAFSLASILAVIGSFGHRMLVIRFGSAYLVDEDMERFYGLLKTGYGMVLVGCSLLAIAVTLYAYYWPNLTGRMQVMAAGVFTIALGLAEYQVSVMRSLGSIGMSMIPRDIIWRLLVAGLSGASIIGFLPSFSGSVGIWMAATTLFLIIVVQILLHPVTRPTRFFTAPTKYEHRIWWVAGLPIWGNSILNNVAPSLAIVVMGFILPPAQVGGFFLAMRLADITALSVRALGTVVSPRLGRLSHLKDHRTLQNVVSTSTLISSVLALSGLLIFVAIGAQLLDVFHEGFGDFKPILVLMSFGLVLNTLFGPVLPLMTMQGHERQALLFAILTNVSGLIAVVAFGFLFGPIGAVLSLVGSRIANSVLCSWYIWSKSGIVLFLPLDLLRFLKGKL